MVAQDSCFLAYVYSMCYSIAKTLAFYIFGPFSVHYESAKFYNIDSSCRVHCTLCGKIVNFSLIVEINLLLFGGQQYRSFPFGKSSLFTHNYRQHAVTKEATGLTF